jgi:hypothetical protein
MPRRAFDPAGFPRARSLIEQELRTPFYRPGMDPLRTTFMGGQQPFRRHFISTLLCVCFSLRL